MKSKTHKTDQLLRATAYIQHTAFFVYDYNVSFTFNTSCKEDILPNGLGDRGNDGGCSRGRCGAVRLAPKLKKLIIHH